MPYTLPPLSYPYNALEPSIDAATMEIHHTKHHQAYVDKLNAALSQTPELQTKSPEELLLNLSTLPETLQLPVRNHAGGHANHSLFWTTLGPHTGGEPKGDLKAAIDSVFGKFAILQTKMTETALNHFGSGWAWLVVTPDHKLNLYSLPNQDSPYLTKDTPLLGIDVWEHAYYLKYQNRRVDYLTAIWQVINWTNIETSFKKIIT